MKKKYIYLLLFLLPILTFAQNNTEKYISNYTKFFLSTLNQNTDEATKKSSLKRSFSIVEKNDVSYVDAFITMHEGGDLNAITDFGASYVEIIPNLYTVHMPLDAVEKIIALPNIKKFELGIPATTKMDKARAASNVDQVQSGLELLQAYKGKDVVIGIIDMGFDYRHINFYASDNSELRVKRVWDQNRLGTPPSGYAIGAEYKTQGGIESANYDTFVTGSSETHGTHVAGIASGSDATDSYQGVAPEAELVFVSLNGSSDVNVLNAIKYIYDYATSVGKPCVVNMSLGSHVGPHDGTSTFDMGCDALQGEGRLLVGSAGNEGDTRLHISKTFSATENGLKTFLRYSSSSGETSAGSTIIDVWGEAGKTFNINIGTYNNTGTQIYSIGEKNASTSTYNSYTLTTTNGAVGTINIYTQVEATGRPHASIQVQLSNVSASNYVGIEITGTEGTVHAWTNTNNSFFSNRNLSGWSNGDTNYTVGEIGGTGKKIISVGAYVSKSSFTNLNNSTLTTGQTEKTIASFSSIGPTLDGRIKPEIAAPGSLLVSSIAGHNNVVNAYGIRLVKKNFDSSKGRYNYYGALEGTSMSSPFVAGVLATWLQAYPQLTPEKVREILQKTSIKDANTGSIPSSGNNTWGYGKIDAWAGIKESIAISGIENVEVANTQQATLIYPNPSVGVFNVLFKSNDVNVKISLYAANGQSVYNQNVGQVSPAQEVTVNASNLAKGVYVVSVKGNTINSNHKLVIN